MTLRVEAAVVDQASDLSELALRAKAYWGYSTQFMQAVTAELTYSAQDLQNHPTFVASLNTALAGFYQLVEIDRQQVELEAMFVDPQCIGQGVGGLLFSHAIAEARRLNYHYIKIQSDPDAVGFYIRMGCEQIGFQESLSIPGRQLPLLTFDLGE